MTFPSLRTHPRCSAAGSPRCPSLLRASQHQPLGRPTSPSGQTPRRCNAQRRWCQPSLEPISGSRSRAPRTTPSSDILASTASVADTRCVAALNMRGATSTRKLSLVTAAVLAFALLPAASSRTAVSPRRGLSLASSVPTSPAANVSVSNQTSTTTTASQPTGPVRAERCCARARGLTRAARRAPRAWRSRRSPLPSSQATTSAQSPLEQFNSAAGLLLRKLFAAILRPVLRPFCPSSGPIMWQLGPFVVCLLLLPEFDLP